MPPKPRPPSAHRTKGRGPSRRARKAGGALKTRHRRETPPVPPAGPDLAPKGVLPSEDRASPPVAVPVVVIIGRPNVGKSTLFNRLCRERRALMSDVPGTTRDWIEGTAHWGPRAFRVIDTGGYSPEQDGVLAAVRAQVERWVTEADATLWMVDGADGATAQDRAIARWLRARARRVFVVVNKIDDANRESLAAEFHRLGFPEVVAVSATHGRRVDALLDRLAEVLPAGDAVPEESGPDEARVAIVGRPNVGKSSILNRLLGQERAIVSDVPGTTRDSVDTRLELADKRFLFTDTAGLRASKAKASEGLEGLTRIMAEKAVGRCGVALLLVDAAEGILEGDVAVARLIEAKNRACVVGVNKWDLVPEKVRAAQWFRERQPADMPFLDHAPVLFVSAKTGQNAPALLDALWDAHRQFHRRFDDDELETFFWTEVQNRPYSHRGRKLVFRGASQVASAPPVIVVRGSMTDEDVHFSYQRHLENVFRERFRMTAAPLKLRFRRG